jgi:hypothetical protein
MKKITVLLSLLLFFLLGIAQTNNLIKKNFITGADITVYLYDYLKGEKLSNNDGNKLIFPSDWKFRVVGITKDNELIIKQWRSKKSANKEKGAKFYNIEKDSLKKIDNTHAYTSSKNDNQFFTIPLSEFDAKCDPYFQKGMDFTFGVMTIPIKLRSKSKKTGSLFELEEKFNIGISAGIKLNFNSRKDRSISLLINTSVSNARLDSLNTNGFQKETISTGAFTIATGMVFKQDDFNVGVFLGWDKVPGILGKNWVHYGKPWVGVGIGFSLFSINVTPNKADKATQ